MKLYRIASDWDSTSRYVVARNIEQALARYRQEAMREYRQQEGVTLKRPRPFMAPTNIELITDDVIGA